MKQFLLALLLLAAPGLFAQSGKSATPLANPQSAIRNPQSKSATPLSNPKSANPQSANPQSAIRAVVVGIPNYHDPAIPDLQYANRDAEAFVQWLQSKSGGSVPSDNIRQLIDEKATSAQVGLDLDWLLETSQAGDVAIIYFSGHGDLDSKKKRDQWGYLLTYDTPAAIYIAGSCPLNYLQNIVSTLAIDQKVKVELFLDACHAGKLVGSATGGVQATAQSLSQQFANELKVLSCQPNEFSLEGTQWGGGRGVFSYHLIQGLTGLADKNTDGAVSLAEIDRYLGDVVPPETAPQPQTPFTVGDRNATLAQVDAPALAALRAAKTDTNLHPLDLKGLEDDVLASADSLARLQYYAFKEALEKGNLLEPKGACADFFYTKLVGNDTFKPLVGLMTRNFAAALADNAQQALNAILSDDPFEINVWTSNPAKYKLYPQYLQRALELIGEQNRLYRSLMAKKLYFEGYNMYFNLGAFNDRPYVRDSFRQEAKKLFLQSLKYEPGAAYVYYSIAGLVEKTGNQTMADSCVFWLKKAIELAPNWKQPYVNIGEIHINWISRLDNANEWLMKAYALDSTSYFVLQEISWLRQYQHRPEEANAICRKMIALRPDLPGAYATLAHTLLFLQGAVSESEQYYLKSMELGATTRGNTLLAGLSFCPVFNMMKSRRMHEAVKCLKEGLSRDSLDITMKSLAQTMLIQVYVQMRELDKASAIIRETEPTCTDTYLLSQLAVEKGRIQLLQGHLTEAEQTLLHGLTLDESTDDVWIRMWALLGCVKAAEQQDAEAEMFFKKAISFPGLNTANYYWEEAWFLYGQFLLAQNRDTEALHAFEKTEEVYPNGYYAPYGMALLSAEQGNKTEALDWLEKSLDRYYPIPGPILEEPLFQKIKKTKRFKEMMDKNFPPGWEKR